MILLALLLACGSAETTTPEPTPAPEAAPEPAHEDVKKGKSKAGKKEKETVEADCNATLQSLGFEEGDIVRLTCADGCTSGSVYGTEVYTADSKVCTAGVHAGAIPATGGSFKAKIGGKESNFKGSEANGVTSKDWTSEWGPTFQVRPQK
jgi:hypothetical protein